ncbi:MAG: dehalogenase [Desulfitobacterium sp.]
MSTLLIFIAGMLFLAGILFVKPKIRMDKVWKNVLIWALYGFWFFMTCIGVSFVYLNAGVGHVKATSTAIFLFGGISVVLAIILARILGIITIKARKGSSETQQA